MDFGTVTVHSFTPRSRRNRSSLLPENEVSPVIPAIPTFSTVRTDGRVRVGIVSPCCYMGGAERWISDLLNYCDGSQIDWVGIAISHNPDVPDIQTVRSHWESKTKVASGKVALDDLAKSCDVFVSWGFGSKETAARIPEGLPVIEVSHCAWDYNQYQCDLADSTTVAVGVPALLGIPAPKRASARIIHNTVSPSRIAPTIDRNELRDQWNVPRGSKVVGWFGRISQEKRPYAWIDGIARLPKEWVGVMVGSGIHDFKIRAYAEHNAPGRIFFPGPTHDVGSTLNAFDLFVLTSGAEGFCIALAEAWLAGLPTVSTKVGILEEHPEMARLLPLDPTGEDVASAILADQADEIGTRSRIAQAQSFAKSELSPERFGREWTDLIVSLSPAETRIFIPETVNSPVIPISIPIPPPKILVRGIGDSSTGYGQMIARLISNLDAHGIRSAFDPIGRDESRIALDPALALRIEPASQAKGLDTLIMSGPGTPAPSGSIILTMWEATRIKTAYAANLNRYQAVIVPCEANAEWLRASGVTVPIRVVPLGIDPAIHHPKPRANSDLFRIGCAGRVGSWPGNRKGLDLVVKAFLDAFPSNPDVRLEVKTFADCTLPLDTDPRIKIVQDVLTDEGLADWYRSLDLFVSASRGEGWGLQPHQAMACGVPTIAPIWGGHAGYMTPESVYPAEYQEQPAEGFYVSTRRGRRGRIQSLDRQAKWCVVDHASLVERMREAYTDPTGRQTKALAGSRRAAEFTWDRSARELAEVMREFGLGSEVESAGESPSAEPNLIQKAGNFTRTLTNQMLAGNPTAPPEVQDERKAICFACDEFHDHSRDKCKKCGCSGMTWKRSMATAACPVGKWGAV